VQRLFAALLVQTRLAPSVLLFATHTPLQQSPDMEQVSLPSPHMFAHRPLTQ